MRFGANLSGYRWDVIAQCHYRYAQCLQSQQNSRDVFTKHKHIIELIRFPADEHDYARKIIAAIKDSINTGVLINGSRVPMRHNTCVDDNLMTDVWKYLEVALACRIESLFTMLGFSN